MFALLGVTAYVLAMIASIPASSLLGDRPAIADPHGTLWRGGAALAGGQQLAWQLAPLRSIATFGPAFDWSIDGGDTALTGGATMRGAGVALDHVSGLADGALVRALAPKLPFDCDTLLQVDLKQVNLIRSEYRATGTIRIGRGQCRDVVGKVSALSALIASLTDADDGSRLVVTPAFSRASRLVDGSLSRKGDLTLSVRPEGAAALPFVSGGRPTTIETSL